MNSLATHNKFHLVRRKSEHNSHLLVSMFECAFCDYGLSVKMVLNLHTECFRYIRINQCLRHIFSIKLILLG